MSVCALMFTAHTGFFLLVYCFFAGWHVNNLDHCLLLHSQPGHFKFKINLARENKYNDFFNSVIATSACFFRSVRNAKPVLVFK